MFRAILAILLPALFSVALGLSQSAYAASIATLTFQMPFSASGLNCYSADGVLCTLGLSSADLVSGWIHYDLDAVDSDPDSHVGIYGQSIQGGITIFLGDAKLEISSYQVQVRDDYEPVGTRDLVEIQAFSNVTLDGQSVNINGNFDFAGAPPSTFTGDSIPNPLLLVDWPGSAAYLGLVDRTGTLGPGFNTYNSGLGGLSVGPIIPEPSTAMLLTLGLVGITAKRRWPHK
jgi:hypothetical protein